MGDIVLGTPGKTVLSESGGSVSWGTGAPTGAILQNQVNYNNNYTSHISINSGTLTDIGQYVDLTPIASASNYRVEFSSGEAYMNGSSGMMTIRPTVTTVSSDTTTHSSSNDIAGGNGIQFSEEMKRGICSFTIFFKSSNHNLTAGTAYRFRIYISRSGSSTAYLLNQPNYYFFSVQEVKA